MLIVKHSEQGYKVKHLFTKYCDVTYDNYYCAIELCRLRSHKVLADSNLVIIKVPFISMWLVW